MTIPFPAWLAASVRQAFGPRDVPTGTGEVVVHANDAEAELARSRYAEQLERDHQRRLMYAWRLCQ